ncbi:phage tail protein [Acetobacter syzygii]|uniref:phage tail protein n=1 Tax=Acetobacter syzygii TaxID=146476 RepID=UPI00156D90EA|nr:phage tail protein [Acetobacter syzygii]NSL92912.1 phage tail protein [Acetobacter syzygii]
MAVVQVNEIDITVNDKTAEGAASAGVHLDAVQDKAEAATDALTGMGEAGARAAEGIADSAKGAAGATDGLAASTTASLSSMKKAYSALRSEAAGLQEQLDKVGSSGGDTSGITAELSRTQTEMSRLQDSMAALKQKTAASTEAQLAWNGQLNQANAPVIGLATATAKATGGVEGLTSALQAGTNSGLKNFLQMGASAGDEISRLTLRLQTAQDRLQQVQVQSLSSSDYGMSDQDAQRIVAAQQAIVDTLVEQIAVAREAQSATDELTVSQTRNASAAKLEGYQVGILMDEAHKFFDMVLAGGNPLQAAFYEVPNAVQVMGGFGETLQRVTGFLSGPGGIAAAAAVAGAAIYKVGAYAESEQEQLAQLSQHLRATRTDYADMAQQAEEAARTLKGNSDLSLDDSRTVVQTIVSVPTVDSSQIDRLTSDARNLAAVMGGTVPAAAKTMAEAIKDPAKAAQDFAQNGMPGFNAGFVLMVQHMQQAGNEAGALRSVLDRLEQNIKGAADQGLTPFQQAWKRLGDDMGGTEETIRKTTQGIGDFFVSMGTTALNVVDEIINGFHKIPDEISSVASSLWGGLKSAGSYLEGGVESGLNAVGATNMAHLMQQGSTANPTFSAPATGASSAAASAATAVTAAQDKQKVATTSATAALAEQRKEIDSLVGSDDSWSGRISDQQRKIQGLEVVLGKLKTMGAQGYGKGYAETLQNLTGQLQAANVALAGMRGPFADLIEQQNRAAQSASALTGYDKAMVEAAQQADDAARSLSGGMASAAEKTLVQSAAARTLANEYQTNLSVIDRNIGLQDQITEAWAKGGVAADHATNYVQAYNYVLDHFGASSANFGQKVDEMAAKLDNFSLSQKATQLAQQTSANNDQLAVLQAQTASIGQNDDARQLMVAHMQAEQQVLRGGTSLTDEAAQAYLKSADAVAEASIAYQHQQQVLDDVTGSLSNMADQLSDGITQGFLQGTSSGMSFKSTLQGVETQIVSMIARMALINPLLNGIDGKSRSTLSDISSLFGGMDNSSASGDGFSGSGIELSPGEAQSFRTSLSGSGASSVGGAASNVGSMSGSVSGLSNLFSGKAADGSGIFSSVGSAVSSIGSYLGIAGAAFGVGEMAYSLFKSLFAKTHYVWDTVSAKNGDLYISNTKTHHASDSVTSKLNPELDSVNQFMDLNDVSFEDGDLGQVGYRKHGKHYRSTSLSDIITKGTLTSDDANMKQALTDLMPTSVSDISTWQQDVESIKSVADAMDTMKVSIKKFDDSTHVTVGHFDGYTGDMATALSTLDGKTLTTSDLQSQFEAIQEFVGTTLPGLMRVTAAGSENLMDQVADLKQKYQSAADTAKSYGLDAQALLDTGNAIAAKMIADENTSLRQSDLSVQARDMAATGNQQGADLLNQQVSADQAIAQLQENWRSYLGDTYAQNTTYQQQMTELEKTLADERLEIQKTYASQALELEKEHQAAGLKLSQSDLSVQARLMAANGDQEGADLLNQQVSAAQEKQQLIDNWQSYYGDSYASNAEFQRQMLDLDQTLAAERLKIQKTYSDQALQAQQTAQSNALQSVTSVFQNMESYVQGLATSDASPLSVQQQYGVANDNLNADYSAALSGDYDALSRLQSDAQTELSLSKQWNGSGAAYNEDYRRTLTMLQSIGNIGSDPFTATLAKTLLSENTDAVLAVKKAIEAMESNLAMLLKRTVMAQTVGKAA